MNKDNVKAAYSNGLYIFKLYTALAEKGISINRFMRDTETDFSTFRRYANGSVQRVDLGVLDRWCDYLNCQFSDIIEYVRND